MTRMARIPAWLAVAAASLSCLAAPPRASAAAGDIAQLSGTAGCIQNPPGTPADGCALALAGSLNGTYGVAVSPDGKTVYGHGYWSGTIDAFSRDAATGTLTQIQCVGATATATCDGGARALDTVYVVLATDQNVYTVGSSGISEFARDPATGMLTYIGCIGTHHTCTTDSSIGNAYHGTLSPDGKHLYTVGPGGTLTIFTRSAATGLLSQSGCLNAAGAAGCTASPHLLSPYSIGVSPDGENAYVGDSTGATYPVIAYTRDAATGALAELNCLNSDASDGCGQGYGLGYAPRWTTVSPDGKHVYVADQGLGGIAILQRSAVDGSISQAAGPGGCVKDSGPACTAAIGLDGPWGLQVSPDNRNVYVGDTDLGNLLAFARDTATGALTQLAATPCIGQAPCAPGRALGAARGVAIAPDGKNVYAAAFASSAVSVFSRELPAAVIPDPGTGGGGGGQQQEPAPVATSAAPGTQVAQQVAGQATQRRAARRGPTAADLLGLIPRRALRAANGRVKLTVRCPANAPAACAGTLSFERSFTSGKVLGRTAFNVPAGRSRALTMRLAKALVTTLARRRKATVVGVLRLKGTADMPATTARRKLALVARR